MTLTNGQYDSTGAISESWSNFTYAKVNYTTGFTNGFTVEILFKLNNIDGGNQWLYSYGPHSTNGGFSLLSSGKELQMYVGGKGYNNTGCAKAVGVLNSGTWYHLSVAISTTSTKFYLNGNVIQLNWEPSFSADFPLSLGATLVMGNYDVVSLVNGPLSGSKIAMSRVYTRALTASEVSTNYQAARNKLSGNPYSLP